MNPRDEAIRSELVDRLIRAGVDTGNLAVDSIDGQVILKGTLPSAAQRETLVGVLKARPDGVASLFCEVGLLPLPPSDPVDGPGRSLLAGSGIGSVPRSRRRLDPG